MSYPPGMWGSLSEDAQGVFWEAPGADSLVTHHTPAELATAQELYAAGFGFTADQYDAMGIDVDVVHAAREAYFDFMGMELDDFPWDEWREAMGYDER